MVGYCLDQIGTNRNVNVVESAHRVHHVSWRHEFVTKLDPLRLVVPTAILNNGSLVIMIIVEPNKLFKTVTIMNIGIIAIIKDMNGPRGG